MTDIQFAVATERIPVTDGAIERLVALVDDQFQFLRDETGIDDIQVAISDADSESRDYWNDLLAAYQFLNRAREAHGSAQAATKEGRDHAKPWRVEKAPTGPGFWVHIGEFDIVAVGQAGGPPEIVVVDQLHANQIGAVPEMVELVRHCLGSSGGETLQLALNAAEQFLDFGGFTETEKLGVDNSQFV